MLYDRHVQVVILGLVMGAIIDTRTYVRAIAQWKLEVKTANAKNPGSGDVLPKPPYSAKCFLLALSAGITGGSIFAQFLK